MKKLTSWAAHQVSASSSVLFLFFGVLAFASNPCSVFLLLISGLMSQEDAGMLEVVKQQQQQQQQQQ
jgi:hypothetical protein